MESLVVTPSAYRVLDHELYARTAEAKRTGIAEHEPHLIVFGFRGYMALASSPEIIHVLDALHDADAPSFMGVRFVCDDDVLEPWIVMDAAEADAYLSQAWTRGICTRKLRAEVTGSYGGRFRPRQRP